MADEKKLCLSTSGLTKVFGFGRQKTVAVDHVDIHFYEGEVSSIVGESGSGKTTLAKMLLGLINLTEGEIYFQGKLRDIRSHKKKQEYWKNIQAIFQDPFSSYNIFNKIDSVLLDCIKMRGGGRLPYKQKVEMMTEACSFVNLKFEELTNKYPFELSGGQMQRVAIARALAMEPDIVLADEPTGNLDSRTSEEMMELFDGLNEAGHTIVLLTHEEEVAAHAFRVVRLLDGRVVRDEHRSRPGTES